MFGFKEFIWIKIIALFFYNSSIARANTKGECSSQEWTKEQSRTQGGGWNWYPGRGDGESLEEATLWAEGRALKLLVGECQFPHKEVKVHERCVEYKEGKVEVFLRMSLRDFECQASKYASELTRAKIENGELLSVLQRYENMLNSQKGIRKEVCHIKNAEGCHRLAKILYGQNERNKALELFEQACGYGNRDSCFNAASIYKNTGNLNKAKVYYKTSCDDEDGEGCFLLAQIIDQRNAKKYFHKACSLGLHESCLKLARELFENHSLDSDEFFSKSCPQESDEKIKFNKFAGQLINTCHQVGLHYLDQKDLKKAEDYFNLACLNKNSKSCFNYALFLEKKSDPKSEAYFDNSCKLGLGLGCFHLGELQKKKKSPKKMLQNFVRGCNLGHEQSCHQASVAYFDRKEHSESLKFSKFACKLGNMKACHNTGILEFKNGNKSESELFLKLACSGGIKQSC